MRSLYNNSLFFYKVGFLEEDMDGDFDPSQYDKIMQSVFDEQYYDEEDDEKPDFSDNELLNGGICFS